MQCPRQLEIASGQTKSRSGQKISSKPTSRRSFSELIVGQVDCASNSGITKQTQETNREWRKNREPTLQGNESRQQEEITHIALYDHSTIETFIADTREYSGTYRAGMLHRRGSVPLMHPSPCGHPPRRRGSSSGTN
jgi:hypothetical protein